MIRQLYYLGAVIAVAASQFQVNYILSQNLSVDDYGRFSLIYAGIGIFVSLFMFGQATSITAVYFAEEKKICLNVRNEVFEALRIISISFFMFGCLGILVWYKLYYKEIPLLIVFLGMLAALSITLQMFIVSLINCMDRYREYFFSALLGSIVLISVVTLINTITGYLIAVTASSLFCIIVVIPSLKLCFGKNLKKTEHVFSSKELILLGWVAIPGMFITSAMGFADKFLMGQILSLKDVALYSMASLLSLGIGRLFISALLKSNNISLLRSMQNDDGFAFNYILRRTEWLLCALCVIATLLYYTLAKQLVVSVFGVKFIESVPIMLALFIGVMIEGMMQFMSQVLVQKRKLYITVINGTVLLVFSVFLNYIFIPSLLIKGAVLTFFMCNLIAIIIVFFQTKKMVEWIKFPHWLVSISSTIFLISFFYPAA